MTETDAEISGETFKIESPLDESEGMTLRDPTTGATFEVAEIDDEVAREYVTSLTPGSTVRVELTGTETPKIAGVKPTAMPDSYGTDYTFETCGM